MRHRGTRFGSVQVRVRAQGSPRHSGPVDRMHADALGRAMVDGDEDGDLAVAGAVTAAVMSVPHMASIVSGIVVPS